MYMILIDTLDSDEDMSNRDYGRLGRRKRSSGANTSDPSHDTPRHKGKVKSSMVPEHGVP